MKSDEARMIRMIQEEPTQDRQDETFQHLFQHLPKLFLRFAIGWKTHRPGEGSVNHPTGEDQCYQSRPGSTATVPQKV